MIYLVAVMLTLASFAKSGNKFIYSFSQRSMGLSLNPNVYVSVTVLANTTVALYLLYYNTP